MKITVLGAGNVGATVAQRIVEGDLGDVVLTDIVSGRARGKALDLMQAAPIMGHSRSVVGKDESYRGTEGSDIVVVTAGVPRRPGMSRDELVRVNADIVGTAMAEIAPTSPEAVVIVVTNPLDVMCEVAYRAHGCNPAKCVGMAGILDSARFRAFIADELGVSPEDVQAMVLGGHGDSMVPLPRFSTVSGVPITELMDQETIDRLVKRTRYGGAEIVELLETGSAYYAPAAAVYQMVRAIALDQKRVLPCSARLSGQYGVSDQYLGVPVKLGAGGVEEIIELPLADEELAALRESAAHVRELVQVLFP